jgi:hypothetical protein
MPPAGFEPAIPAGERLQTHALDSFNIIRAIKSRRMWQKGFNTHGGDDKRIQLFGRQF